jgi:NADH-quinone oxidoreductase subunit D
MSLPVIAKYEALHAEGEKVQAEFATRRSTLSPDDAKKDDAVLAELMRTKYSHRVEPPRTLPAGECYVETECPRGQMGFHVVGRPSKENVPLRVRARSSCFCNLSVAAELCRGCLVADIPAIIGSIDVVMGEIDR